MKAAPQIVSKSEFARIAGVSNGRVTQWITAGQIGADALVGRGQRARVRVDVALKQLKRNLDVSQHLGDKGRAKLDGNGAEADQVVDGIRRAKLKQLKLINGKLSTEAAVRSGRYIRTDDARQEIGRVNSRWLALFGAALVEFANVVVSAKPETPKHALQVLRTSWDKIREREARVRSAEATGLPPVIEDKNDARRKS